VASENGHSNEQRPFIALGAAMRYRSSMKRSRDKRWSKGASCRRHLRNHYQAKEQATNNLALVYRAGFSLLELLLVAAIILVLASLYFGPSSGSRERALQAACQKNLQKLYIAMQIYGNDFAGTFPKITCARNSAEVLDLLVPRYISDTSAFICPASDDSPAPKESLKKRRISYAYYMGRSITNSEEPLVTDKQVNALAKAVGQPIFSSTGKPPGNNHGKLGGNLLFCDGHIDSMPPIAAAPLNLTATGVLLNP